MNIYIIDKRNLTGVCATVCGKDDLFKSEAYSKTVHSICFDCWLSWIDIQNTRLEGFCLVLISRCSIVMVNLSLSIALLRFSGSGFSC